MSSFLTSLKSDLLDRRVLPIVVVLGVALVAALAFVLLAGGSSTSSSVAPLPSAPSATSATSGVTVTAATASSNSAVSETTSGAPAHGAAVRDPFKQPTNTSTSAPAKPSGSEASSNGSGSSGSSGSSTTPSQPESSGSSKSTGGSSPSKAPSKPSKPKQPATIYHVTAQFGLAPTVVGGTAQLKRYPSLKRLTPLPSADSPLVVFAGVSSGGKEATFQIVGEVIPAGPGKCAPSASQCQTISLQAGQTERLETLPVSESQPGTAYELQILKISASKASAAKAARVYQATSADGLDLLRRIGFAALPGMHYSVDIGVLVPRGGHTFAAHIARGR